MKESEALEQVLVLLGHAKISKKYKDATDEEAINIAWELVKRLRDEEAKSTSQIGRAR